MAWVDCSELARKGAHHLSGSSAASKNHAAERAGLKIAYGAIRRVAQPCAGTENWNTLPETPTLVVFTDAPLLYTSAIARRRRLRRATETEQSDRK
jgi:hypothetical protein